MKLIDNVVDKVKEVGYNRCGKCPAYWHNVDYWGEADEGCLLHKDIFEFCGLSLLPHIVVKPYLKYKMWQEEKQWLAMYEEECEKWEQEEMEVVPHENRRD